MRNNKGFTLMELVAAIFIGGMVTAALVLIWKTASTQTTQSQRQTVMRNQVSNFQRQLYRDFYSADIIIFPNDTINANPAYASTFILAGLKKAKRVSATQYRIFRYEPQGPSKFFAYCVNTGTNEIRRIENTLGYSAADPASNTQNIAQFTADAENLLNNCQSEGVVVLSNFNLTSGSISNQGEYTLTGYVERIFSNRASTTPVYIDINEHLMSQGGI